MRAAVLVLAFALTATASATDLRVASGFSIERIAVVPKAREMAALPNGDLIVGTLGSDVLLVPGAEERPRNPRIFASFDDTRAAGVAYAAPLKEIFVATMHHVWAIPYEGESVAGKPRAIADVRTGPVAPGTHGDVHTTTSVAYSDGLLYVAAGSSCNATMDGGRKPCVETDPTRAAVSVMKPDGSEVTQRAHRIRNAIALAVDPRSGAVWIGDAGQDDLPSGHPYEFLDDLSAHPGDADYGWPECEENHRAYVSGARCAKTIEPLVELPAYSTIIGAAFYPERQRGKYAFPAEYRGGLFVAVHGSWHTGADGCNAAPPRVVFVPMKRGRPARPVDWANPATQWRDFVTGFQSGCTARIGRPTGVTVGSQGSLFVADDAAGVIYRVRPSRG